MPFIVRGFKRLSMASSEVSAVPGGRALKWCQRKLSSESRLPNTRPKRRYWAPVWVARSAHSGLSESAGG